MIIGTGIDVVQVSRFAERIESIPGLAEKLFTSQELESNTRAESLAARFAAKEAAVKAFGGNQGFSWHDIEVEGGGKTAPKLLLHRKAAQLGESLALSKTHLSLSHDGDIATAIVILEGLDK